MVKWSHPWLYARIARLAIACVMAALVTAPAALADGGGAVYTETNSVAGNSLLAFDREGSGALTPAGSVATGGNGTGVGLGSGHSVIASSDGRMVLAVNAGSDTVSAFAVRNGNLKLLGAPVASGGNTPTSVTSHGNLVYVMNAGSGTISGFTIDPARGVTPIPGSTQALAAAGTGRDSQIQFDKSGRVLIVDERGVNLIQTFVVRADGVAGPPTTIAADGGSPFGFDVDRQGHVLFSNAALGAFSGASSYDVAADGRLTPNGPPVTSGQAAACWLAAVRGFAFTTNAGSGSIARFAVAHDGSLQLIGTTAISPAAHPLDEAAALDGDFLYVLADGLHQIVGYKVGEDGSLSQVATVRVPMAADGVGAH